MVRVGGGSMEVPVLNFRDILNLPVRSPKGLTKNRAHWMTERPRVGGEAQANRETVTYFMGFHGGQKGLSNLTLGALLLSLSSIERKNNQIRKRGK